MTVTVPNHIAIDARPLSGGHNGFVFYTLATAGALLDAGWEVSLLSNQPLSSEYQSLTKRCQLYQFGSAKASQWEQHDLVDHLAHHPVDLYLATHNRGIPRRSVAPVRTILSLLDIIPFLFPRHYLLASKAHFVRHELRAQLTSMSHADTIVTISQQSARDISQRFKRQDVTPLLIPLSQTSASTSAIKKRQFVYVGGVDPRKQIPILIAGFAKFAQDHADYQLILIGNGFKPFEPLCHRLGIGGQVIMPGYVDEPTKQRLLTESTALVYPSLYEGYGLVIAEGFAAKTPVIAGQGGSQAEIGGNAVRYINPTDANDIAAAMSEVLEPTIASALVAAGTKQLAALRDPAVTQRLVDYYASQAKIARKEQS